MTTSETSPGPATQDGTADPLALARAGIGQARRKATDVIEAAREKGEAVIDAAREKGEAVIEETREKTYRAAAETNRMFQEHPIAAVAAAAAAGAVLAIFLPRVALAGQATKLAGRAVKAAVASEAAQAVYSGIKDTRDAALRSTAGKAATAVGERMRSRKARSSDAAGDEA
jgi:ElaB/YqjD/DUF883 family membrane-anchored ribosome-binding protein